MTYIVLVVLYKMKTSYPREYAHFGIRSARKPRNSAKLSGVVAVTDSDGRGFVYIDFSDSLITAVGKVLPYGVSVHEPAYLSVLEEQVSGLWVVSAQYLDNSKKRILWASSNRPSWVKHVRRVSNEESKKR